jgi:uncharacterized membrane protein
VADNFLARRFQVVAVSLDIVLIALVVGWQLMSGLTPTRLMLAVVFALPLLAPLRGLQQGNRRTFAWTTLCVILYFVIGITEAVAQPSSRIWSAPCLLLALALFVTLIAYLRVTRPGIEKVSP